MPWLKHFSSETDERFVRPELFARMGSSRRAGRSAGVAVRITHALMRGMNDV
jgi:hypothetical protein